MFNIGPDEIEIFVEDDLNPSYLTLNPEIAKRYFRSELITVKGERDLFLKNKDENTIRIVIQGASSVQGFPYGNSISAPRLLKGSLKALYPNKNIEVINLGVTAVSSYVLLDMANSIVNISPDIVIIYSGHNEFYGVFGAASSQSATAKRSITKTFLYLKRFRVFRFLLSFLSRGESDEFDPNKTLMEKMALNQKVPFKSKMFLSTSDNYIKNLSDIIDTYKDNGIPTILSSLVFNLKDQPPFLSDAVRIPNLDEIKSLSDNKEILKRHIEQLEELLKLHPENALLHFLIAKVFFKLENFAQAEFHFLLSHQYDNLRFRAPNEFNLLLNQLATNKEIHFLDLFSAFRSYSKGGVIGSELIHEHVHPNIFGYKFLAYNFLMALAKADLLPTSQKVENLTFQFFEEQSQSNINLLDSIKGQVTINALLNNWPFNLYDSIYPPTEFEYKSSYELDLALDVISGSISHYNASLLLCEVYLKNGDFTSLLKIANSLDLEWVNRPRINLYQIIALLQLGQTDKADKLIGYLIEKLGEGFVKEEINKLIIEGGIEKDTVPSILINEK
ncbi:hypothetical protein ACFCT7_16590 [Fulvivirgaceae bacterium LMO-SS25]